MESQDHPKSPYPADSAGASATVSSAVHSSRDNCCEPYIDYWASRDPSYTQSQSNRPCFDTVWGNQMSGPVAVTGMSVAAASVVPPNAISVFLFVFFFAISDGYHGAHCHPVPLDASDAALRSQRLLAYGKGYAMRSLG